MKKGLPNLSQCTGCSACVSSCPTNALEMGTDKYGFSIPNIFHPDKCIGCNLCIKKCPVINEHECKIPIGTFGAAAVDPIVKMYSSSGGLFRLIGESILDEGGLVYGAAYNSEFQVVYKRVECKSDLKLIQGAKYSQCRLDDTFSRVKSDLKAGYKVLFTGTPCVVAGLSLFVGDCRDNLFLIDFVCHGVPSPIVWKKYLEFRKNKDNFGELPVSINQRSKDSGWSHYKYSCQYKYKAKTVSYLSSDDPFMKLFLSNKINNLGCEECKFKGYRRYSDITLGDFWGVWDLFPKKDDNKGTSVITIFTRKGFNLLNNIYSRINMWEVNEEIAYMENPSMFTSSQTHKERSQIMDEICSGENVSFEDEQKQNRIRTIFQKFLHICRN